MTAAFSAWAAQIRDLHAALLRLWPLAESLGVPPGKDEAWFELLQRKLRPQAAAEPWLVVAVVGGTNIGKSVIFNHLAGEEASGVSPLAAGTKHPVCIVPQGFSEEGTLAELFEGFELCPWRSSDDPLGDAEAHRLFWRAGAAVPPRLLLLDTPDIDSDAQVNWQRAEHIRHVADVLVAVLTQQKYNDAAVKQFFRSAAEADKPAVVVFNQCEVDQDSEVWPIWLRTFVDETGVDATLVYVVPYDRAAAESLALPFYEVGRDGRQPLGEPGSLRDELASLRFDEIKIRTLRGALAEVLDPERGAPNYLARVRQGSANFAEAAAALSSGDMARVQWPALPTAALVDEIRDWWDVRRNDWSRSIHGFYRTVGAGIAWPFRKAWEAVAAPSADPMEAFLKDERTAIVTAVEHLLHELERLASVGNDTLRPRLQALLAGHARAELLRRIEASHAELPPVDDDYREFLRGELDQWGREYPRVVSFLRSLDHAAALARPAITVSLAISGWLVAGGLVHDAAVQAAGHSVSQVATEAAITGGITTGGEALVTTTGEGIKHAAGQLFRRLQAHYAQRRASWLAGWLERELLGDLLADLRCGAEAAQSEVYRDVEQALAALKSDESCKTKTSTSTA